MQLGPRFHVCCWPLPNSCVLSKWHKDTHLQEMCIVELVCRLGDKELTVPLQQVGQPIEKGLKSNEEECLLLLTMSEGAPAVG